MLSSKYKTAVITGSSSGLGKAFSEMLQAEGIHVYGTSRKPESIQKTDTFTPVGLDLHDSKSVDKFISHCEGLDQVDIFINNAGYGLFGEFEDASEQAMRDQLDALLYVPIRLTQAIARKMQDQRSSCAIVNVASLAAQYPIAYMSLYNTAKAGLAQFSKSIMLELEGTNVCIIDLRPGDYRTEFNNAAVKAEIDNARMRRAWEAIEKHLKHSPEPEHAAQILRKLLIKRKSGSYRCGTFFQTKITALGDRILPKVMMDKMNRDYYKL